MQDLGPDDVVGAVRGLPRAVSQQGLPLVVVGAGCRTCRPSSRPASPTPSGCSATRASTGSTGRPPTPPCAARPDEDAEFDRRRRSPRCTRRPPATRTSSRPTARWPGTSRRAPRSPPTTSGSPRPRRRPSSRSASSARATSGPRRPSASTCGRWPTWPTRSADRDGGRRDLRCRRDRCEPRPQSLSPARDAPAQEGSGLQVSGADRVHRPPLRAVPAPAGLTGPRARYRVVGQGCVLRG